MKHKTTPIDADTASEISADSHAAAHKKNLKNPLTSGKSRNPLLSCCHSTFFSLNFCATLFFVVFVVIISVVVWVLSFVSGFMATMDAVDGIKELVRSKALLALQDTISTPAEVLQIQVNAATAFDVPLLDSKSRRSLDQNAMKSIAAHSFVSEIYYGLSNDDLGSTEQLEDGGFRRWLSSSANGTTVHEYYTNDAVFTGRIETEPYNFKPTGRPWYKQAVARKAPGISDVYLFMNPDDASSDNMGMTFTYPHLNASSQVDAVFSIDYNLNELNVLLKGIKVGKTGSIFMVERNGLLLASSKSIRFSTVSGDRLKAVESPDDTQKQAAQIIEESIGFDKVYDGYTHTFPNGQVSLEVVYFNPRLKSGNLPLLDSPWIMVFIHPIFRDYTQNILWFNLISCAAAILFVVLACVIAMSVVFCVLVLPLKLLVRDFSKIQSMHLEEIKQRRLHPLYELRHLQDSFYRTVAFLKMYKSFLPSYLLQDVDKEEEDDHFSQHGSHYDSSSRYSGSIHSHALSQSSTVALQKLHRFELGLHTTETVAVVIRLLNKDRLIQKNHAAFVDQYSRMISVVQTVFRVHKGSLDRFSEHHFVGTFTKVQKAVPACLDLRKRLSTVTQVLQKESPLHLDFCIGMSIGEVTLAVLGTESLKTKRIFGSAVDTAERICSLGADWPVKLFTDSYTEHILSKKQYVIRPVARLPQEKGISSADSDDEEAKVGSLVHEIVGTTKIQQNEWIYEKRDRARIDSISMFRKAYSSMEKENYEKAEEYLSAYLEVNPDDAVALRLQNHLKQFVE